MEEVIKRVKRKIRELINGIAWNKQYKAIIAKSRKSNFVLNTNWYEGCRILMMVPHADDELISSYSILCRAKDVTVYYCGFTGSNNTETNRNTRRSEILNLCSELNVEIIEGNGACENLSEVLCCGHYDTLLLPSIVDWHPEHRKISYMICEICSRLGIAPSIYCYSVTVPNESIEEVLCVPLLEGELRRKYDLFKRIYLSQKVMPLIRLKLNERINGFQAGVYAAETFQKWDTTKWMEMVTTVESREEGKEMSHFVEGMKKELNDLNGIRQASRDYYNWIDTL